MAAAILLAACGDDDLIRGSGDLVRQTVDVTDFDTLDIGSGFQVTVGRGPPSAVIEVDDNLLSRVVARNRDGTLRITLESGASVRDATLRATVTMPNVSQVVVSGGARVEFLDPFSTSENLLIEVSGASRLSGDFAAAEINLRAAGASEIEANLDASQIEARALGASRLNLSGTVDHLELELSGASRADLRDLEARIASVDLSGASDAELTVGERLTKVIVTGASHLDYFGNPVIDSQTITGASSINQR